MTLDGLRYQLLRTLSLDTLKLRFVSHVAHDIDQVTRDFPGQTATIFNDNFPTQKKNYDSNQAKVDRNVNRN